MSCAITQTPSDCYEKWLYLITLLQKQSFGYSLLDSNSVPLEGLKMKWPHKDLSFLYCYILRIRTKGGNHL